MSTIEQTQDEILELMDTEFVQPVVEQGIVDIDTVKRNLAGDVEPYIAIHFGMIQNGRGKSFVGPRGHDYILPIYVQAITPDPTLARRLQNKIVDVLLGEGFPWSGQIEQRPGGAIFPMTNSNSATEAYVSASSFGLLVQFE